ncbi:hypothetical protein EDF56_105358 [Novosphingobium sp. PhB165]|nr:hypothetical protein EDF56_105358 [Novosphingobium sp. PhB165]
MAKFPVLSTTLLTSLAAAALALPGATMANETVAHLKGNLAVAAPKAQNNASARTACHPDPAKGRDCRHRAMQRETEAHKAFAQNRAETVAINEVAINEGGR